MSGFTVSFGDIDTEAQVFWGNIPEGYIVAINGVPYRYEEFSMQSILAGYPMVMVKRAIIEDDDIAGFEPTTSITVEDIKTVHVW